MASTTGVTIERKKSYGIGGAGNIRRPSDVIYLPRTTNADGTRRRSSVWSSITATSSPFSSLKGKRTSVLDLFIRKGSAAGEEGEGMCVGVEGWKELGERGGGKDRY